MFSNRSLKCKIYLHKFSLIEFVLKNYMNCTRYPSKRNNRAHNEFLTLTWEPSAAREEYKTLTWGALSVHFPRATRARVLRTSGEEEKRSSKKKEKKRRSGYILFDLPLSERDLSTPPFLEKQTEKNSFTDSNTTSSSSSFSSSSAACE